ncbi:MAG TPA: S8 family serine peptidase [Geobacteraceae bacterium]
MRWHSSFVAAAVVAAGAIPSAWGGRIDPGLLQSLNSAPPAKEYAVIVKLTDKVDLPSMNASLAKEERMVRHVRVMQALRDKATASGKDVRRLLAVREQEGKIIGRRDLWIINGYALTARGETVRELAARDDVAEVAEDRVISLGFAASGTGSGSGSWNQDMIGAPILWRMGYTGQGAVVATIDSGVDINHPALRSTWRGGPHDWHDSVATDAPTSLPFDDVGHGTHVMGVMVAGNDQNGDPIGVAPGAKWIAAKISDSSGNTQLSWIHDAFQWALDPDGDTLTADAPNVVNCSWGIDTAGQYNPNPELQQDIQALATAGIAVVFAAGNSGPSAGTSVSPANYPGAFSVGATDSTDVVTAISSRGPSASDGSVYPTVVAPGSNIRTTDLTGGGNFPNSYTYADGTSLAAPHVAGGFALLLSINPSLTVPELENAVKSAALDLGPAGPDNSYGYGRLDIIHAAENLNLLPPHAPSGDVDGDGSVTVKDALMVLRAAVGLAPWSATLMYNGDVAPLVNGVPGPDRKIGVDDAVLILRKVVGASAF